jgi:hypothetical protein
MAEEAKLVNSQYYVDNKAPTTGIDSFFFQEPIDTARWNQAWPYQILFIQAVKKKDGREAEGDAAISYKATQFKFTLPIPPQDLSINMPLATSVQATLGGIVEQHGGAPFRDIVISGTTGITPIKNTAGPKEADLLSRTVETIFAGSANAARSFASNATTVVTGKKEFSPNINQGLGDGPDRIPEKSTGYYQFRLLERLLESYQEIKKRSGAVDPLIGFDPKDLRLGFRSLEG